MEKIVTNNPMVLEELAGYADIEHKNVSFLELLFYVRDKVHQGYTLLSHPLSGSVKPMETPYKSILISDKPAGLDIPSLARIEHAIEACGTFRHAYENYGEHIKKDFQLVDLALIKGALHI